MTSAGDNVFASGVSGQDRNGEHAPAEKPSLSDALIRLSDDFGEFSDVNAFMCNAFANALKEHERLNKEIITGARICADWLQQRTGELKDDIRQLHMRHVAEHDQTSPADETGTGVQVRNP